MAGNKGGSSSGSGRNSRLAGRDAKSGQFIPINDARRRPNSTVVERVPLPGKSPDRKK